MHERQQPASDRACGIYLSTQCRRRCRRQAREEIVGATADRATKEDGAGCHELILEWWLLLLVEMMELGNWRPRAGETVDDVEDFSNLCFAVHRSKKNRGS
jgi:hypothetical protein